MPLLQIEIMFMADHSAIFSFPVVDAIGFGFNSSGTPWLTLPTWSTLFV